MKHNVIIASRGSRLALAQTRYVAELLRRAAPEADVKIKVISTRGARDRATPLTVMGGTGVFTKEVEEALLRGEADVAVHSLKDLPTVLPEELCIAAVPPRESPFDALIAPRHCSLDALPPGARIGTSSLRRTALLKARRPDLDTVNFRGNVETRLAKTERGEVDAALLACAGLERLGLGARITQVLDTGAMMPAVGQGALGVEVRRRDTRLRALVARISDPNADAETRAERALLAELGGGCQIPLGALGRAGDDALRLMAAVCAPGGAGLIEAEAVGSLEAPGALGRHVASLLLEQGARELLETLRT